MDTIETIRTRKSVRTFDGRPLTPADLESIRAFARAADNPWGVRVEFVFLDPDEHGLSSPVITGKTLWMAAKVAKVPHAEEAYGYSFERVVLHAWSLGVGTTWIGGTLDRPRFEEAAGVREGEAMFIVTPLGYSAADRAAVDVRLRAMVRGDERLPSAELFFDGAFGTPLAAAGAVADALEAVRWAPSAANRQPWRVVRRGPDFHFYECHDPALAHHSWDVQRIDMGIALCHFTAVAGGTLRVSDPGLPTPFGTDYVATVAI
ncbi:MAG: nitroreductase [Kiritimatiellae bacterium]|nr:nitroreductase [Kiritimatiellia bacterium]